MLTHLHMAQPRSISPSGHRKMKSRSKSLGSEGDLLLQPFVPVFDPIQARSVPEPISGKLQQSNEDRNGDEATPVLVSALYGLINGFIVLPVLMSFGSIIYRDEAFAPYMPVLVKLTVVSGMVHQLCFSMLSSLPFAVGQVQDAGLIFLSSMAGNLVQYCQARGFDDEVMLATVTVGLSLATALLGLGLIVIGKLRLAQYVQLLPTPVIGGYLAYIGYFCGVSGLALMATGGGSTLSIPILLNHAILVLPGFLGGVFIYILVRQFRHMLILPLCIVVLLSAFYLGLMLTDTTVADATKNGWIRPSNPPPAWYDTWAYLKIDKVAWEALPSQTLTMLSMIFVVALSSALDVAAIELEMNEPLNYNSELSMVGISNLVSGMTGGYTGSYIFSQSIFSLRAGIKSRIAGFILALCEFIILVLPVSILSYVPNFFFGSLLIMICVDLVYEWLWEVRNKLTPAEYSVCLATFLLIQLVGVEYGIILGVALYLVFSKLTFCFGSKATDEQIESQRRKLVASPKLYGATNL